MAYALTLGAIAFLLAVMWGKPLISILKLKSAGKKIRLDGPTTHQVKIGTPTMGGLMIIVPVLLITGALNIANLFGRTMIGRSITVPMAAMFLFGLLGIVDDIAGLRGKKRVGEGLLARTKFLWQFIIAIPIAVVIYFVLDIHSVALPGLAEKIDLGFWYLPIAVLIIVWLSNAVNVTDGLDGLAGSAATVAFACYGVIANLQGQTWLTAFCFTVVGATMAFLWFNAYPAEMFMGDVGSLALGATLGRCGADDRPVAALAPDCTGFLCRRVVGDHSSRLFPADGWKTVFQDGPAPSSFRVERMVGDAYHTAVLADRCAFRHVGDCAGALLAGARWTSGAVVQGIRANDGQADESCGRLGYYVARKARNGVWAGTRGDRRGPFPGRAGRRRIGHRSAG